jgi:hypothetical protein
MIYVIAADRLRCFKVGFSRDARTLKRRLIDLSRGLPVTARLVGVDGKGTVAHERELHALLSFCRAEGEWFWIDRWSEQFLRVVAQEGPSGAAQFLKQGMANWTHVPPANAPRSTGARQHNYASLRASEISNAISARPS